jgi:hypothetical protein
MLKSAEIYMKSFLHSRKTGCRSLVVVLSLSIQEVMSLSPTRAGHIKPKTFKIGSDCSFSKSIAFRSESQGLSDMTLKT